MSAQPFPPRPRASENIQFNAVRETVTLVVEAGFDRRFWSMHAHRECLVRDECGRQNALDFLDQQAQNPRSWFVGVLDADWDRLEGTLSARADVVWTDARDLEASLLPLPVLEKLILRHGAKRIETLEAQWGETFRERLVRHAVGMGRLRWRRRKAGYIDDARELEFQRKSRKGRGPLERPDYTRSVEKDWAPSMTAVIQEVLRFCGASSLSEPILLQECAALPHVDASLLCNGHDLMGFLAAGFSAIFGEDFKSEEWAERVAQACDRIWLEQTEMWQGIVRWEASHPGFRVLKEAA